jgi:RND family efflux transporter MFP subunit
MTREKRLQSVVVPGLVLLIALSGYAVARHRAPGKPERARAAVERHEGEETHHDGHESHAGSHEGHHHEEGEELHGEGGHEEGMITLPPESLKLGGIKTAPVVYGAAGPAIQANGEVVPDANRVVKVGPFVSGRITRVSAHVGDTVRPGQVLAVIDSIEVAQARAAYQEARAELSNAERQLATTRTLARSGVFTQKSVDEICEKRDEIASELAARRVEHETELRDAEAAVRTAQAALDRAESARRLAEQELSRRKALVAAGAVQYRPLEEARREMAEAERDCQQAETALRLADANLARAKKLFDTGVRSRRELEEAQAARDAADAELKRAQEQLRIAKQVLARERELLDSGVYASREIQQAENELLQAEKARAEAEAALHQAKQRLSIATSPEKKRVLVELENRLAALDSLLRRETSVARQDLYAQRETQAAEAAVAQARARLLAARNTLKVLRAPVDGEGASVAVTAPIGGRVLERAANRGQVVTAQDVLFTILDLSTVWVEARVYAKDARQVRAGQPVTIVASAFPDEKFTGKVSYMGDVIDEQTRTLVVRCEVANPRRKLKPGVFVKVSIGLGRRQGALSVPASAVQREGERTFVFVATGRSEFQEREVRLGTESGGYYEVLDGLKPGETVVTEGAFLVKSHGKKEELGHAGHAH